jgi:GTPase SAR1 family protein
LDTKFIVLTGTAGAGKSSLAAALARFIEERGATVVRVNLDPAAESLPYDPAVDIRSYVRASDFMAEGLGPNGALIAAVDSLIDHVDEVRREIDEYRADYAVVDTPGQLELFAFRYGGPLVLKALLGESPAVNVFLIDAVFVDTAANVVSALTLASSVAVRLALPQVNVVSKADLLLPEVRSDLVPRLGEPGFLGYLLERDGTVTGWRRMLIEALARAVEEAGFVGEVLAVSIHEEETLAALYAKVQQILAAGDDYRIYDVKSPEEAE